MIVKWPAERLERLKQLIAQEMTSSDIAKELGVSRNAVCGKAMRSGLKLLGRARELREEREAEPELVEVTEVRQVMHKKVREIPNHPPRPKLKLEPVEVGTVCNIFQLQRGHCRWPIWGLETPFEAKHYCGQQAIKGSSYCLRHAAMVYQPMRPRTTAEFRLPR